MPCRPAMARHVAAYLVGTQGTAEHALFLGLATTITHTAGVFALGFITLALSQFILPEQLYPWLSAASGLLVVCIGLSLARRRLRPGRSQSTIICMTMTTAMTTAMAMTIATTMGMTTPMTTGILTCRLVLAANL